MDNKITLACFSCGKKKDVVLNRSLIFAFELVEIANTAGMLGVLDMKHSRALVFCNDECSNNQKTKRGTYRVRPIKCNTTVE